MGKEFPLREGGVIGSVNFLVCHGKAPHCDSPGFFHYWTSNSFAFPIFLLSVLEFVLPSFCPSFTIVHCVCGDGEAENFSFFWLVTRQLETPLNPVADCALCRNPGLWNTCRTWMGRCVISFGGWERGGDSEYSACGRKDATDIQWTRGQTVAVVSCSPEPTPSFFHFKWALANRSKQYFSAALLLSVVMSLHLYNRILVEAIYAILYFSPWWWDEISMSSVILEANYWKWQSDCQPLKVKPPPFLTSS